jgi:8-oxo-dGTP pyrophosphatase MutT (NUDIX family)
MPMPRPVPPQVIPRPADWRLGDEAPWAALPASERRDITLARVLAALAVHGQLGPMPEGIGVDGVVGASLLVNEFDSPEQRERDRAINAAVLAVLFEEDDEARLIFTRRSSSLRSHRGEVSFPGGRLDPGEDAPAAALREAYEEIALDPAQVTMVGWIHPVVTVVTGSVIMPVVASVPARPHVVASPAEVERVFDVSLADLADLENFHEERWRLGEHRTPGSSDDSFTVWFFEVEGEMIWGATARMLHELLSVVLTPPA